MAGGSAIRGSRVAAGRWGKPSAVTRLHDSMCPTSVRKERNHPAFGRGCVDSRQLGLPTLRSAIQSRFHQPATTPKIEPYKTHLAYVKERRTDNEAADILSEAPKARATAAPAVK